MAHLVGIWNDMARAFLMSDFDSPEVSSGQSLPPYWPLTNCFSCSGIPDLKTPSIFLYFWQEDLLRTQVSLGLTLPCLPNRSGSANAKPDCQGWGKLCQSKSAFTFLQLKGCSFMSSSHQLITGALHSRSPTTKHQDQHRTFWGCSQRYAGTAGKASPPEPLCAIPDSPTCYGCHFVMAPCEVNN